MRDLWKRRTIGAVLAALALVATACGRSASTAPTSGSSSESVALATTTPPGTQEVDSITWGVYRETSTMDPIYVFDYPDNTATSLAWTMLSNWRHRTTTRIADPMNPNQNGAVIPNSRASSPPIGVPTTIPPTSPTV